jgi:hypothetical protein
MATPPPLSVPLYKDVKPVDVSNLNLAGVNTEPAITSEFEKAMQGQEDLAKSLEMRYRDPNWFKVSAGFLKPQLGGFAASLGSASEAMGENVEQQRAIAPTIAQIRAQASVMAVGLQQEKLANEMYDEAIKKPGGMTSEDVARIAQYSAKLGAKAQSKFENQRGTFADIVTAKQQGLSKLQAVAKFNPELVNMYWDYITPQVPGINGTNLQPGAAPKEPEAGKPPAEKTEQPTAQKSPRGRILIPGVSVDALTEDQYREEQNKLNTVKQETYKELTKNSQIQSIAGKEVYQTSQQIHDLAGDPEIGRIFALFEKGNPGATIGQMLESQSMSQVLANVRQYAINRRLGGGESLTKLNNLESLMKDLQNNMQNAVINPTNLRTEAEIASMPSFKNSQDAFLRRIRYIGNEGLVKYENQHALERASKSKDFDPQYWTSSPEYASVSKNASARRDAITRTPATQDRPSWMRGSIDETAFKGAKKENKRMTAKELRESANKED